MSRHRMKYLSEGTIAKVQAGMADIAAFVQHSRRLVERGLIHSTHDVEALNQMERKLVRLSARSRRHAPPLGGNRP